MNDINASKHNDSHSVFWGYIAWIFGFTGSHRFYYGKKWTGSLWFFSFGLFGIGWLVDLFLIPDMDREADRKYVEGEINYDIAWLLLTFAGYLGFHRFYLKKYISGVIYLCTGGLFFLGWLYDLWNLNEMIDEINREDV